MNNKSRGAMIRNGVDAATWGIDRIQLHRLMGNSLWPDIADFSNLLLAVPQSPLRRLQLVIPADLKGKAWVHDMARRFRGKVGVSLRRQTDFQHSCTLVIDVWGEDQDVRRAMTWAYNNGAHCTEIPHPTT